jgi:hypothetical protein
MSKIRYYILQPELKLQPSTSKEAASNGSGYYSNIYGLALY